MYLQKKSTSSYRYIQILAFVLFFTSLYSLASAQLILTGETYIVETRKGNVFKGSLKEESARDIILDTKTYGEIVLPKDQIVRLKYKGINYDRPFASVPESQGDEQHQEPNPADALPEQSLFRPGSELKVFTQSGRKFEGKLIRETARTIHIQTVKFGDVYINKSDVTQINAAGTEYYLPFKESTESKTASPAQVAADPVSVPVPTGRDQYFTVGEKTSVHTQAGNVFTGKIKGITDESVTVSTASYGDVEIRKSEILHEETALDESNYFDNATPVKVYFKTGEQLTGSLLHMDEEVIILDTRKMGKQEYSRKEVFRIDEYKDARKEELPVNTLHAFDNRYTYTVSPLGYEAGDVYFDNYMVLYSELSVGVAKNVAISAGILPAFFVPLDDRTLFWASAQGAIPITDKVAVSIRYMGAGDDQRGFTTHFTGGGLIIGTPTHHHTLEILHPSSEGRVDNNILLFDPTGPAFHYASLYQWKKGRTLVSEIAIVQERLQTSYLFYTGVRFDSETVAWNLGLALINRRNFTPVPTVGLNLPLFRRK